MPHYEGTVSTVWSPAEAFAYVAEVRNFSDWDPGTRSVQQVVGDGPGLHAAYDLAFRVGPATMTLRYTVVEWEPPQRVVLTAHHFLMDLRDEITVDTDGPVTTVTYDADVTLKGPLHLLDSLVDKGFQTTGDRAKEGLHQVLMRSPSS